jgi:hypothetical protein
MLNTDDLFLLKVERTNPKTISAQQSGCPLRRTIRIRSKCQGHTLVSTALDSFQAHSVGLDWNGNGERSLEDNHLFGECADSFP